MSRASAITKGGSGPPSASPSGRRYAVIAIAVFALAATAVFLARGRSADPERLWETAEKSLREGRFDEAERASERLSRARPPKDVDWMLRAQIAMARDRTDDAIALLARVQPPSPLAAQASLAAGQLELRRSRFRFAENHLRRALEIDPTSARARRELIYILGYQSRRPELSDQFAALAERGALGVEDVLLWCLARGIQWKPEEVAETLQRAIQADPDDRASRLGLAAALVELRRLDDADRQLAPMSADDPEVLSSRGQIAWERGDVDAVRQLVSGSDDDRADLSTLRGRLALRDRDFAAAADHFQTAVRLAPLDQTSLSGLAQALNQLGRRDEALAVSARLKSLTKLAELLGAMDPAVDGRNPRSLVSLGHACEAIGQPAQARAWFQLAVAIDPLDREAQEGLSRVPRTDEHER